MFEELFTAPFPILRAGHLFLHLELPMKGMPSCHAPVVCAYGLDSEPCVL